MTDPVAILVVVVYVVAFAWGYREHRRRVRNARYFTGLALKRLNGEED